MLGRLVRRLISGRYWRLLLPLVVVSACGPAGSGDDAGLPANELRIVSLSPGITESLFELGLGSSLVGRSDYCDYPPAALSIPMMGTSITPNLEALVRNRPTHILTEANQAYQLAGFEGEVEIVALEWLTAEDLVGSIRVMGTTFGVIDASRVLADRLRAGLQGRSAPDAPEVLVILGTEMAHDGTIWYLRSDSLHGRAIEAAGVRNALSESVNGPPTLSLEELFRLDPDNVIFVGSPEGELPLARFSNLTAVRQSSVGRIDGTGLLRTGPGVLDFVTALRSELQKMGVVGGGAHADG